MAFEIKLLPDAQLETIIPLLQILNPALDEPLLRQRLAEMREQGYKCVGVYDEERLVGCSGLWITTRYYVGRFVEPDNVVLHPEYRGQGLGEKLLAWIWRYAKSEGCVASELNCYVTNSPGQKFWMNQGYKIMGFRFQANI
jgi:GNAT superfamily N-acetyltransferase